LKSSPKLPAAGVWTRDSLADLLAPALGREQSADLVAATAARLGLTSARLDDKAALSIIDQLGEGSGLVALSARFARARMGHHRTALKIPSLPPQRAPQPKTSLPASGPADNPPKRRTWQFSEVVFLLANALGKERSAEVVKQEAERLNLREPLQTGDVLRLLGALSQSPGMIGTVAQFAKSRLMLPAK
jgi:hypothetical protein